MIEDALEVATDPDYRFELAIQLGKLDIAKVVWQLVWFISIIFIVSGGCQCAPFSHFILKLLTNSFSCYSLQEIATEAQSEGKWKQLGELAMSTGMVFS